MFSSVTLLLCFQLLKNKWFSNHSFAFLEDSFSRYDPKKDRAPGVESSVSFVPVFSPRVLGVAMARYDFLSRDAQELSLLQGDVIRVYSKLSNGWWKGEVDGRVGLQIRQNILHDSFITVHWSSCILSGTDDFPSQERDMTIHDHLKSNKK